MCVFCDVVGGSDSSRVVFEDDISVAFLDHRPLFPGHTLVVPRDHYETLTDLPPALVGPFFLNVQLLARTIESVLEAQGSFVAMNNRISQSVPHFHTHVVPRRPKDGLRGFFWPRTRYASDEEMAATAALIRAALDAQPA
jgi:histidine triad (HIT) family protein